MRGIAVSASHIYISALAFAPKSSKISQLYAPRFRNLIDLDVGRLVEWPGKQIVIPTYANSVAFVDFSPDGRRIVSCLSNEIVCVWDVETGQITAGPFVGHTDRVVCAVYSTDGNNILSASTDGTIRTWNTERGAVVESVTVAIDNKVHFAAFSHNRKNIAWARGDGLNGNYTAYISVHDVETGSIVSDIFGHSPITCFAFSPDDKTVVSGSQDGTICVWSTQTGGLVAGPFEGHQDDVRCISYSHNGTFIVSGSYDKTTRLWKVGGTPPQKWVHEGHTGPVHSVSFSSDGRRVVSVSGDWAVHICDVETGEVVVGPLKGHVDGIYRVAISPDGRHIASGSWGGTVYVWNVEVDWKQGGLLDGDDFIYCLALSNDRKHVVLGSDEMILYWDVETGKLVDIPYEGDSSAVWSIAYLPDGKRVVSGSIDGTIRICEVASGRIEKELSGPRLIYSIAISNNGRYIVSASSKKANRLWDAETGDCIHILHGKEGEEWEEKASLMSSQISFSPDDKYVLFKWRNGFRIWEVETGSLVTESKQQHDREVVSVAFSHDGKLVATGSWDKAIRLWDARTGEPILAPFIGHSDSVDSVAFSPDDEYIVSGSGDRTVRVWEVTTGQTIMGPLRGHTKPVSLVAFSQDGNSIFSLSRLDKTIRIWSIAEQVRSTLFTNESEVDNDGWVKGKNDELLFWVPVRHRLSLHRPNNTRVIGRNETRINLTNAQLGDKWSECYTP